MTDANLVLGYLDPAFFLGGHMTLDAAAARRAIETQIAVPLELDVARAAFGIHEIINEEVARAFRVHASERGFDYRTSSMVAFGGSGPVHALSVARKLGIPRVIFPVAAGVMSALGLLASPLSFEVARTRERFVARLSSEDLAETFEALEQEAVAPLLAAGVSPEAIELHRRLDMRYHGQGHEIEVALGAADGLDALPERFRRTYEALYAFAFLEAPIVITNWKVEARGPASGLRPGYALAGGSDAPGLARARKGARQAWFAATGGYVQTPVLDRYALRGGDRIDGPALVEEQESTVLVAPGDSVRVDEHLNLVAELRVPADACGGRG